MGNPSEHRSVSITTFPNIANGQRLALEYGTEWFAHQSRVLTAQQMGYSVVDQRSYAIPPLRRGTSKTGRITRVAFRDR
jgi:hypothetical protein